MCLISKQSFIYICIATTLTLLLASSRAQTVDNYDYVEDYDYVEEIIPPVLEDGRSFKATATELSNCACVDHSQCKMIPKQTSSMMDQCSATEGICCHTDDIDTSALKNLLLGTPTETKTEATADPEFDNCSCFTEAECIDLQGTVSIFGPNSPLCPDRSYICCILAVSDLDLFAGLLGTEDGSLNVSDSSSDCRCVPEDQCSQDLSLVVNVRSFGVGNVCESTNDICCDEKDIIEEIVPPPGNDCECVPNDRCGVDLSIVVNVRSSVSSNICESALHVCCDKNDIIETIPEPIVSPVVTKSDKCICVAEEECLEEVNLAAVVNVRRRTVPTECEDTLKICCPKDSIKSKVSPIKVSHVIDEKRDCTCVPGNNCKQSSENLSLRVDIRSKTCQDPLAVCCFPEDIEIPAIDEQFTHNCTCYPRSLCGDTNFLPESISVAARCVGTEVCCQKPKEFEHSLSCGQSHVANARIDVRIRLGFQAKFAEFPWMVAIFEMDASGKEKYKCGGSLIHPSIVLTTAHCIDEDNGNFLKIRAGDWDISSTVEKMAHVEKHVNSRILHPSFSARSLKYNVGLLYLNGEIRLQHHINTICLPRSADFTAYDRSCIATGWGKNEFGEAGQFQTTLKKLTLPLVGSDSCQESLRKTRLGPRFRLDSTAICAGGSRDDTCTGDGGSPLVCLMKDGSNRYMEVGAVAWGIECGNVNIPGVYASTFAAVDWIRDTVARDFGADATKYFT